MEMELDLVISICVSLCIYYNNSYRLSFVWVHQMSATQKLLGKIYTSQNIIPIVILFILLPGIWQKQQIFNLLNLNKKKHKKIRSSTFCIFLVKQFLCVLLSQFFFTFLFIFFIEFWMVLRIIFPYSGSCFVTLQLIINKIWLCLNEYSLCVVRFMNMCVAYCS